MSRTLLVLYTHGSRDPRWLEPFNKLEAALKSKLGDDGVRLAHMEVSSPTLSEVAEEAAAGGVTLIRLLPLFMSGGGHVALDVPRLAREAEAPHPGLAIEILPAIGEHPRLMELVIELAAEAAQ